MTKLSLCLPPSVPSRLWARYRRLGMTLATTLAVVACLTISLAAQFQVCETNGSNPGDRLGTAVAAGLDSGGRSLLWIGAPAGTGIGQQSNTGILIPRDSTCRLPPPFFFPLTSPASGDRFASRIVGTSSSHILVSAPGFDGPAGLDSGRVRWIETATGITQRTYLGGTAGLATGSGLSVADIDGDGILDHILGSPGFVHVSSCSGISNGARTVGEVRVYSGANGNLLGRTQGDWHCSFRPVQPKIGSVLSGLGDVDGDGKDEFLIGSPLWRGRVYVMSLGTGSLKRLITVSGAGDFGAAVTGLNDIDGDGAPDFAVGSPAAREVTIFSGATGVIIKVWTGIDKEFGATLTAVGDQDGDGLVELLVGAPGADNDRGVAHIFTTVTGNLLASVSGQDQGDRFGEAAAAVPTWTGDARPEIAIGAPSANSSAGRVVVVTLDPDANPPQAYWSKIGSACAPAGTSGINPRIGTPNGAPEGGGSRFSVSVSETLSGTAAFLFLGASRLPQPFCLGVVGLPTCCLEVSPWQAGISIATSSVRRSAGPGKGIASLSFSLPASIPSGVRFYAQWYVMDPGGVAFPGTMTSALELVTR